MKWVVIAALILSACAGFPPTEFPLEAERACEQHERLSAAYAACYADALDRNRRLDAGYPLGH